MPLRRFRSIRKKVFASILFTSIAALFVAGLALSIYDVTTYRETLARNLAIESELIGRTTAAALQFDDRKFADENLALLKIRPAIRAAALYNSRGAIFASYARTEADRAGLPAPPNADGFVSLAGDRMAFTRRIVENREVVGTVYLETDLGLPRRIASYAAIVLLVMLASLLVSILSSVWLQGALTEPIVEIAGLARRVVERKDYSVRARRTTEDEVGTLALAFNDMLAEIERRTTELEREMGERAQAEREVRRLNDALEQRVSERTGELQEANRQLEAFSYSVSHDLRAPLRAIDGFGQAIIEDYGDRVDEGMKNYLARIRAATLRMGQLIEDLLGLSQVSRAKVTWSQVDLTALVREVLAELQQREPSRAVHATVWEGLQARVDPRLMRIVLENLLGNAWKFTSRASSAQIEFGVLKDMKATTYFVRDNGAGFDMQHADHLFQAFQRLHAMNEFPGTGVGLVTVSRIIHKHGGRIWAHAEPGIGATFYFTLGAES